jgi:hypothetical protein
MPVWSQPTDITSSLAAQNIHLLRFGPGTGVALGGGELLVCGTTLADTNTNTVSASDLACVVGTDTATTAGLKLRVAGRFSHPGGIQAVAMAILHNGSIVFSLRVAGGLLFARSDDSGTSILSPSSLVMPLPAASCNSALAVLPNGQLALARSIDRRMSIMLQNESGAAGPWNPVATDLWPSGQAGCSGLASMGDGRLGLLFEQRFDDWPCKLASAPERILFSMAPSSSGTPPLPPPPPVIPLVQPLAGLGRWKTDDALGANLGPTGAEQLCRDYVKRSANATWREPQGALTFPYLVPAGPYTQCWDWDSVFLGTATLNFGAGEYFAGAMKNFFAATNLSDGSVTGCLTTTLPTVCSSSTKYHDALHHAKPILIQGAWASVGGGGAAAFETFKPAMEALLGFWDRQPRRDPLTGLRTWHDQMESGADNCVLSECPNPRSTDCWTDNQAFTLASADVITMLQREHVAFALFSEEWAAAATTANLRAGHLAAASEHRAAADTLTAVLNERLWREDLGFHQAWNVTAKAPILSRTYVIGFPLWAGLVNASQAAAIARTLSQPDMLSAVGLRSTSSSDPRYNNDNEIVPYSNWRGPMWVNANALTCYGLMRYGFHDLAIDIATRVTTRLAADLRNTTQWHEAYSTGADRSALAVPGFLSWDTLVADLLSNLRNKINPFELKKHRRPSASMSKSDERSTQQDARKPLAAHQVLIDPLGAAAAALPPPNGAAVKTDDFHPVRQIVGRWTSPPQKAPSTMVTDGPLLGNGDLGAVLGGVQFDRARCSCGLTYFLGKQDFWTQQAIGDLAGTGPGEIFMQHVAAGQLSLSFALVDATAAAAACGASQSDGDFAATQDLWSARVNTSLSFGSSFITETSALIDADENVLLSRLTTNRDVLMTLSLVTPNRYGLPSEASATSNTISLARQSNKWVNNGAVLSECSPLVLNVAAARFFQIDSSGILGQLLNQTSTAGPSMCMWLAGDLDEAQPHQSRGDIISMAPCGQTGTGWRFDNATGTIVSADKSGVCVGYYIGSAPLQHLQPDGIQPVPCNGSAAGKYGLVWTAISSANGTVSLQARNTSFSVDPVTAATPDGSKGLPIRSAEGLCLSVVRPNLNISLGIATALSDGDDIVPFSASPVIHNALLDGDCRFPSAKQCEQTYSATINFTLKAGKEYTLRIAAETTRTSGVSVDSSAVRRATARVRGVSPAKLEASHAARWKQFWNASAVSLGPKRSTLESFWYGSQYMLNSMARNGGTITGLLGPFSTLDPVGWADGITLDYNAEANLYGAASSNHAGVMNSYFPTLLAAIPLGKARASLPSWHLGGHESTGSHGQQTEAMGCGCSEYNHCVLDVDKRACPEGFGGYDGIELPLQLGGFAELHSSPDGALRSVGAMASGPFIEYYEHTLDPDFLRDHAYPFVSGVARFYASYIVKDPQTDKYEVPHSCAQEFCSAQGTSAQAKPPGSDPKMWQPQRSPTIDLSYAKWILSTVASWAATLGVDADEAKWWHSISSELADYPVAAWSGGTIPRKGSLGGCEDVFPWAAASNCTGFAESTNTDTNESAFIAANFQWPIANFAPIHPTGREC